MRTKKRLIAGAIFLATVSSLAMGSSYAVKPRTVYVESPIHQGNYFVITIGESHRPVKVERTDHK
jgi:hypothetical protein